MADNYFQELFDVNVGNHTEKRGELTYLSWSWAWAEIKKKHPDAYYTIYEDKDGNFYHTDGRTAWVKTGVTIDGIEHIEYLPVMDFRNKSIPVESITSTDVNKTIQRSLTKACARHGLGLYIYAGEDLPEVDKLEQDKAKFDAIVNEIHDLYTKAGGENFDEYVGTVGLTVETYPKIKAHLLKKITDGGKKK